ncbi:MAG TPA: hypothetical protein PK419_02935 [Spirochaetota bacterium]|jgi:hypothetical protein|nr:hypothetical protein [Spirochaetota bacterium]HOH36846.1 hypothetical protein [Spirochaetota bacterium]HPW50786.1 hypothetical protein [Spirochaetota bacterium]HPY02017.1 hypothetical protein [Spirochaetota bacterium]HQA51788.1 hypothetical protein [Spirochaetota bacterium]
MKSTRKNTFADIEKIVKARMKTAERTELIFSAWFFLMGLILLEKLFITFPLGETIYIVSISVFIAVSIKKYLRASETVSTLPYIIFSAAGMAFAAYLLISDSISAKAEAEKYIMAVFSFLIFGMITICRPAKINFPPFILLTAVFALSACGLLVYEQTFIILYFFISLYYLLLRLAGK